MKTHLGYGLYFMLIGPIFGWLALVVALPVIGLFTDGVAGAQKGLTAAAMVLMFGWMFMHLIGAIPAFLTGLLVSGFGGDKQIRLASAMIAGALTVWLIRWWLFDEQLMLYDDSMSLMYIGIAAGALTVLLKHRQGL